MRISITTFDWRQARPRVIEDECPRELPYPEGLAPFDVRAGLPEPSSSQTSCWPWGGTIGVAVLTVGLLRT